MQHLLQPVLIWEAPYLDVWSIAHFSAGFVGAYLLIRIGLLRWRGLAAVLAAAIFWEIIEQFDGTRFLETNTNSLLDILLACAGYGIGAYAFNSKLSEHNKSALAFFGGAVFAIVCLLRFLGA